MDYHKKVWKCTGFYVSKKWFGLFPHRFKWTYVESGFIFSWLFFYWSFEELLYPAKYYKYDNFYFTEEQLKDVLIDNIVKDALNKEMQTQQCLKKIV